MTTARPRPAPGAPVPGPPTPRTGAPTEQQDTATQAAHRPHGDRPTEVAPRPATGAQSLVHSLEAVGCEVVFGIPGGAILPAYDPLFDSSLLRHILVRHEQGAGHAATGYAQATGRVGVCIATSGPGATNLVTPLADAMLDSVPVVAITGQVGRKFIGTDAFQEADICGITLPITKHNMLVTDPADIPRAITEAFHIASTGRPGPVLVDLPKDVLQAHTTFSWPVAMSLPGYRPTTRPHSKQIREAARLIAEAERPVLYVGGGVIKAEASAELLELAEETGAPVVTTLMARGAFPDGHRQNLGMPGMHGTVAAVAAMQKSDLLIALGARFDDRVTGDLVDLRPRGQDRPRGHRPGRDRQEPARRRADRGRRPRGHRRADRGAAPPGRRQRSRRGTALARPRGGSSWSGGARRSRSATTTPPTARCPRST